MLFIGLLRGVAGVVKYALANILMFDAPNRIEG